jgi:putative oxidoreductase
VTAIANDNAWAARQLVREDVAKLLNRVTVGVLILFHTWAVANGEEAIRTTLAYWGLPTALAWSALFFEGIAPIMVIAGFYARIGAWIMVAWMVMAFAMAHIHTGHLWQLMPNGVGWRIEVALFFLVESLVIALQGAGRYGLNIGGRWN